MTLISCIINKKKVTCSYNFAIKLVEAKEFLKSYIFWGLSIFKILEGAERGGEGGGGNPIGGKF